MRSGDPKEKAEFTNSGIQFGRRHSFSRILPFAGELRNPLEAPTTAGFWGVMGHPAGPEVESPNPVPLEMDAGPEGVWRTGDSLGRDCV